MKLDTVIIALKTIASALVWGLGQLFNRQWLKALFFFAFFALFISIEFVFTGNYGKEFDFFDRVPGRDLTVETSKGYVLEYFYNFDLEEGAARYSDPTFLEYVAELNGLEFVAEEGVRPPTFIDPNTGQEVAPEGRAVSFTTDDLYTYMGIRLRDLAEELDVAEVIEPVAEAQALEEVARRAERALREEANRVMLQDPLHPTNTTERIRDLAIERSGLDIEDPNFEDDLDAYITANLPLLQDDARTELLDERVEEVREALYPDIFDRARRTHFNNLYTNILRELYGDQLLAFDDILAFKNNLQGGLASGRDNYNSNDYNRMLLRLYFAFDEDDFERYENDINNFFYEQGGFFLKGFWGIVTLGETPQRTVFEHRIFDFFLPSTAQRTFESRSIELSGHHSTQLLLRGLISSLLFAYFMIIYIWNIRDTLKTAKTIRKTKQVPNQVEYFKNVYEDAFEYIVLLPALGLVTFISLMPILFGMFVAFTNYNIRHIPPGQLIEWVGFDNFRLIFTLGREGGLPFGQVFFQVLWWTIIWAVFATLTCFFGGFFQAVILNNKRVKNRKVWRAFLILPWAVPALISQMIFRVMFADTGYVNSVLENIGVYDLLHRFGMLGRPFAEAGEGLQRLLYFGDSQIQWLSNEANPWFVRIFLIFLNIWLGFPFFMALMSGVMTSIDKSLYEAASIDGATGGQQFWYITMPLVLFATSPLLIMTFAGNFNNFGVIYFITGGGPGGDFTTAFAGGTDILISWIYKLTTDQEIRWYSMASVFSILIFLIIGTISVWNFTRTRAFKEVD